MTKSTGVGRGGARRGSGPKPKHFSTGPRTASMSTDLVARDQDGRIDLAQTSINVLNEIALCGTKESSRVTAAGRILKHLRDVDPGAYLKARADKKRNADVDPQITPPDQLDLIDDALAKHLN